MKAFDQSHKYYPMDYFLCFFVICIVLSNLTITETCLPDGKSNKNVKIGSDTYVCVTLGPLNWNTTGEYLRVAMKVEADKLASFKIPQSWSSNIYVNDTAMRRLSITEQDVAGTGLGVSVSSMGVLSYQRVYRQVLKVFLPTASPTRSPTFAPTEDPSIEPSAEPTTISPSQSPTVTPTTVAPSEAPTTAQPSVSFTPTEPPTIAPSAAPSIEPTITPTVVPTTTAPSVEPTTTQPSVEPSVMPTVLPTTTAPSQAPTLVPTQPTVEPTVTPTVIPTITPTLSPTVGPSTEPSTAPVGRRMLRSDFEEHVLIHGLDTVDNSTDNSTSTVLYGTTSVTFPMLMAIISVDNGKVQSVVWDDFCNWCSSARCVSNTVDYNNVVVGPEGQNCYVHDDTCLLPTEELSLGVNSTVTSSTTNLCELTVYVVWHGTDSAGAHFQSAASRFSKLDSFQMKNFTGSLQDQRATL